ncbi:N-dimethylarginine dimethylaminohydrolase [Martelella mediterranea]|uniref:arginine deiminase n=2 Tax=Martelella mediterranea TaxID=293089 RepID=A0A4V2V4Y9_9HYPH|nr:N-dimethylarginine dimethylaminohydrolase [Martelella mediterranea]
MAFGAQTMAQPIKRVIMRKPGASLLQADPAVWHYGETFNAQRAISQYDRFADLVAASGAEIIWFEDKGDGLADAMFTHDPSLCTEHGAVLLNMGKPLRKGEVEGHAALYEAAGVPVLGRLEGNGTVEGGDCVWVDEKTLCIGRGVRSNAEGIAQVRAILAPYGIEVLSFDLPLWQGEEACLHLMSVISPLADKLALVYAPLLPAPFYQLLKEKGYTLVEAPTDEFMASNGLNLNVLPTRPFDVIAVAGFDKTKAAMEAAGCTVHTFEADALCIACEGGPTCLTRPFHRG